jgi:hypothetical protein
MFTYKNLDPNHHPNLDKKHYMIVLINKEEDPFLLSKIKYDIYTLDYDYSRMYPTHETSRE